MACISGGFDCDDRTEGLFSVIFILELYIFVWTTAAAVSCENNHFFSMILRFACELSRFEVRGWVIIYGTAEFFIKNFKHSLKKALKARKTF